MANYINRPRYLQQLIDRRDNGEVKIITGPRRSGKSWLLSHIYRDYLLAHGVSAEGSFSHEARVAAPAMRHRHTQALPTRRKVACSRAVWVVLYVNGLLRFVNWGG